MKIKELTKEQRERIEKYKLGKKIIQYITSFEFYSISFRWFAHETIKRIEDEIKFLNIWENINSTKYDSDRFYYDFKDKEIQEEYREMIMFGLSDIRDKIKQKQKNLKQELEDYKLMEKLE